MYVIIVDRRCVVIVCSLNSSGSLIEFSLSSKDLKSEDWDPQSCTIGSASPQKSNATLFHRLTIQFKQFKHQSSINAMVTVERPGEMRWVNSTEECEQWQVIYQEYQLVYQVLYLCDEGLVSAIRLLGSTKCNYRLATGELALRSH